MRGTDSTTLFLQARLEFKAAEAFDEEARSAQRLIASMTERRDETFLSALSYGVPRFVAKEVYDETTAEIEDVRVSGIHSSAHSRIHRDRGEALMVKRDKQFRKELNVRFSN